MNIFLKPGIQLSKIFRPANVYFSKTYDSVLNTLQGNFKYALSETMLLKILVLCIINILKITFSKFILEISSMVLK